MTTQKNCQHLKWFIQNIFPLPNVCNSHYHTQNYSSHILKVFQSHIKEANLIKYITFSQVLVYVYIMYNVIFVSITYILTIQLSLLPYSFFFQVTIGI